MPLLSPLPCTPPGLMPQECALPCMAAPCSSLNQSLPPAAMNSSKLPAASHEQCIRTTLVRLRGDLAAAAKSLSRMSMDRVNLQVTACEAGRRLASRHARAAATSCEAGTAVVSAAAAATNLTVFGAPAQRAQRVAVADQLALGLALGCGELCVALVSAAGLHCRHHVLHEDCRLLKAFRCQRTCTPA